MCIFFLINHIKYSQPPKKMEKRYLGKECIVNFIEKDTKLADTLELLVFNASQQKKTTDIIGEEDTYKHIIYELLGEKLSGKTTEELIASLKSKKYGWNSDFFLVRKGWVEENDNFIMNPFVVEEGVLTCSKCGGNRTYSYSKQTRSSDEPMSTFAQCMNCKFKWVYSG